MPTGTFRPVLTALLVFGGGMAALAHQFLWTRRLIDLLGASNESSTRVFACFFLGLAVGAAAAALRIGKISTPWRAAAFAEVGVAVFSLPVIFLPAWTDWLWPALGTSGLMGFGGTSAKTLLAFAAIFPPACCMGFSFPVIIRAALVGRASSRSGSLIFYGLNTFGGAIGLLVSLGWMLEKIGIMPSMMVAAGVNLIIALVCLGLARGAPAVPRDSRGSGSAKGLPRAVLLLAFLSGAITLALEVLGLQMLLLVSPATIVTPGAILFAVILTLSIPPLVLPWLLKRMKNQKPEITLLRFLVPGGALCIVLAPVFFMALARSGYFLGQHESVGRFSLDLITLALLAIGPAWLLLGTLFPLAIAWAIGADGPGEKSRTPAIALGILLAVNGIGGFIGAEAALHLLLPAVGIYGGIASLAGLLAVSSVLLTGSGHRGFSVSVGSLAAVGLITYLVSSAVSPFKKNFG